MAEQINLTAPVTQPTIADYQVASLILNWLGAQISIQLIDNTGGLVNFTYTGTQAINMMIELNKANLTNNSLQKRIFTQLIADGKLAGSVSGSPA